MKLTIDENSANYYASVVTIGKLHDVEGADRLKRTVVLGNNILVGLSVKEGDKMIYFVSGTQLSEELCFKANLYEDSAMNLDTSVKGYVSPKRRLVRAIKLRGHISDGMLVSPDDIANVIGNSTTADLKEGDRFTHIEGIEICKKYEVIRNKEPREQQPKQPKENRLKDLIVENQFKFHSDTPHWVRELNSLGLRDNTRIIITRKYHGSSLILSNILTKKKLNWFEKLLDRFIPQIKETYGYVFSSGKPKSKLPKGVVIEGDEAWKSHTGSFYSSDIWKRALELNKENLEKGITLYGEIVGKGIQGDDYTYGFEYEIFIYRITQTNVDGITYEFSWEMVKEYCRKYGLRFVDEYFNGNVNQLISFYDNSEHAKEMLVDHLERNYLNKSFQDCKVDEGICIRVDSTNRIFKMKSPNFVLKENKQLAEGIEHES